MILNITLTSQSPNSESCDTIPSLPYISVDFLQYEGFNTVEYEGSHRIDYTLEYRAEEAKVLKVHVYLVEREVHVNVLSLQLTVVADLQSCNTSNVHLR